MKYAKPVLGALLALVVLALIVRQVTQAVRHTFPPPALPTVAPASPPSEIVAQLDPSTARVQQGVTLMRIQNVHPGLDYSYAARGEDNGGAYDPALIPDTGLWIKMPLHFRLPPGCVGNSREVCGEKALSLTARASNGTIISVPWRFPSDSRTFLLASIPPGFPGMIRWLDVSFDDKHGHRATWRITHLPPSRHVLVPPLTPQTTFVQGNVRAAAVAYRGEDSTVDRHSPKLFFEMHGTITHAAHQWRMGPQTETREWEPVGFVPRSDGITGSLNRHNGTVKLELQPQPLNWERSEPYLNDIHWVRRTVKLQEFETYDETVTFHNVHVFQNKQGSRFLVGTQSQTLTSPSGVVVTLEDIEQTQPDVFANTPSPHDCSLVIHYPNTLTLSSLPGSPLWRQYKSPVSLDLDFPKPLRTVQASLGKSYGTFVFHSDKPLPKVIANFPVILQQRVDLRTIPMTFTLPIGNGSGKKSSHAP